MKFTEKQQSCIDILRKYPDDIIMWNGWLTGGHGIKLDMRTVGSLKNRGVIINYKLSANFLNP